MFSTSLFFISFSSFWILSSVAVISSNNPVYSVLFLVLSFFNATGNLLLLQVDFIPLSFIVIYVGAIAVLFLFVIMMLNIKLVELINTSISFYPFLMVFSLSLIWQLLIGYQFNSTDLLWVTNQNLTLFNDYFNSSNDIIFFRNYHSMGSNIVSIGKPLFTVFSLHFILSGFILFVAMVGAIVLTLKKTFLTKSQVVFLQVLTDSENLLIHYR